MHTTLHMKISIGLAVSSLIGLPFPVVKLLRPRPSLSSSSLAADGTSILLPRTRNGTCTKQQTFDCDDMYPASDAWHRKVTIWNALKGRHWAHSFKFRAYAINLHAWLVCYQNSGIYHGSLRFKHHWFLSPPMWNSWLDVLKTMKWSHTGHITMHW